MVTRVVDVPVGQVWQAWTDPEQVRRWWGPTGFTCPLARIDLVTFKALDQHRTELIVTEYGYSSDQILELSQAGLEQVLDKLANSLQEPPT